MCLLTLTCEYVIAFGYRKETHAYSRKLSFDIVFVAREMFDLAHKLETIYVNN